MTSSGEPKNTFLSLESLKACASEGRYKRGKPGNVYLHADRRECGCCKGWAMSNSSMGKEAWPHQLLRTTPQTHYSVCFTPLPVSLTAAPICHTLLTVGLYPWRCLRLALRKVERHQALQGKGKALKAEGGVRRPVFCVRCGRWPCKLSLSTPGWHISIWTTKEMEVCDLCSCSFCVECHQDFALLQSRSDPPFPSLMP